MVLFLLENDFGDQLRSGYLYLYIYETNRLWWQFYLVMIHSSEIVKVKDLPHFHVIKKEEIATFTCSLSKIRFVSIYYPIIPLVSDVH